MFRKHGIALGLLLGLLGLLISSTAPAQSPTKPPAKETLVQRLARTAKLTEEQAERAFQMIGPAIRDELTKGNTVGVPGLGSFRVVRVAEHKDLRNGRPTAIPAANRVEFLGSVEMGDAANSDSAVPAETVPEFKYILLPNQTPGQKMPRQRTLPTRSP